MKLVTKNLIYVFFIISFSCQDRDEIINSDAPLNYFNKITLPEDESLNSNYVDEYSCIQTGFDLLHEAIVVASDEILFNGTTYYRFKWLSCEPSTPSNLKLRFRLWGVEGFVCGNNTSAVGSIDYTSPFYEIEVANGDALLDHQFIGKKAFLWRAELFNSEGEPISISEWTCFGFSDPDSWNVYQALYYL